jgi:peptidoglycan glycosyltransferase
VNTPILRLFVFVLVLFALLAGFTSWWSVVGAEDLRDNPRNAREVLEEQRTRRGPIRARGGEVIAGSQQAGGGTYARRYPLGDLFAFPVGYSYLTLGRTGLEQSRNDVLAGNRDGDVDALFESLRGDDEAGDEVRTTLDVDAQRRRYAALTAGPAPSWRSSRTRARSGSWRRRPRSTRTPCARPAACPKGCPP